ncbi:LOB domain-containing protein 36 [Sesamum angolense]|uniref:LOB domain-containing protein 36 n=1 Tax=Sesamum angolense TaxID=2727404 RepID=A0AAE2C5E7_9LAMI|nr:LOB domain-containing protein 36 [Sesamum angolense]
MSVPCAGCKCLRRKCTSDCVFAPYFPADNPTKFTNVHKVYGASNVAKLLKELGTDSQREAAANTLAYDAECRLRDPVHGCVGYVAILQQQLRQVHHDLECAKKELSTYIVPSEMIPLQQPQQNFVPSVYQMMPSQNQQMLIPMGVPLPHRGQLVIREPNLQEQHRQQEILEAQQLIATAAAMEQEMLRAYEQQQLQHPQQLVQQQVHDLVRFNKVFDDGAGPSTATGVNEMPEGAATMEQEMLRAYEQQQLHHLQQQQEQELLRAYKQQEQELLRAYKQQQLLQQQGHDLVWFNNVSDDGAGPSTATGFNKMPEEAAAMEQNLLRAYEQQQLPYQQRLQQQGHDLVRFSNVFDDGAGPSTATGFNEMPEEAAAQADGMQPFLALGTGSYETNSYHHIDQHHNLAQDHFLFPSHPHTDDHPHQLQLVATEELFLQQQEQQQQQQDVTSHDHLQPTVQQLAQLQASHSHQQFWRDKRDDGRSAAGPSF